MRLSRRTIVLTVVAVVVGAIVASLILGGGGTGTPSSTGASTTATIPAGTTNPAVVPDGASTGPGVTTPSSTTTATSPAFQITVPATATAVHTSFGATGNDESFVLGPLQVDVHSELVPGVPLMSIAAAYPSAGWSMTRATVGGRDGYLLRRQVGATTSQMFMFLDSGRLIYVQAVGASAAAGQAPVLLASLSRSLQ